MAQGAGSQGARDLEAHEIATRRAAELRTETYETLVASYLDRTIHEEIVGATGAVYDVEIEAFWETPRKPGTLVVHVIVGWPSITRHEGECGAVVGVPRPQCKPLLRPTRYRHEPTARFP